jgi:hypothetical protein
MFSNNRIRQIMKAGRADISALLLIAFVFQLVMPVVALAAESSIDKEFQTALRHSICRVNISNDSPEKQSHTDGFVCDWCTLCVSAVLNDVERRLPDVYIRSPKFLGSILYEGVDVALLGPTLHAYTSAPRAPPFL